MKKIIFTMLLVAVAVLVAACSNEDESKNADKEIASPVEIQEVTKADLVIEKTVYGRTAPSSTTPIMVQAPGEIDTLEVENGDLVEEDDLIATIKTQAGNQNIYAAKDGEIASLKAESGGSVTNTEPLAVIADFDPLKVQFSVTADARSLFKKEDTLKAMINDKEFEAEIASVGTMPDDTGLYPIEATVDNNEEELLPGVVAVLYVPEQKVKDAIMVPTAAVVEESDGTFIYVVENDKAIKKEITVKETQSGKTAIEGEVKQGDSVIVSGQLTLSDGSSVNVVKEGNKS